MREKPKMDITYGHSRVTDNFERKKQNHGKAQHKTKKLLWVSGMHNTQ